MDGGTIWLSITGLVAGFFGGLLGIGGSIVMIPAMTELMGPQPHLFQAAALLVNFFVAAPSAVQHARAGALDFRVARAIVPAAIVAAVCGVLCSDWSVFRGENRAYLTGIFGLFLLIVAIREIGRLFKSGAKDGNVSDAQSDQPVVSLFRGALLVGLPTGFVSGFLGVGGGVLAVPLQRRLLGLPTRTAIANSSLMIVGLSLVGASVKHWTIWRHHTELTLTDPARLAAFLISTAILGAWIGSRLTHRLPVRTVRLVFAGLLVVAGVRMVSRVVG